MKKASYFIGIALLIAVSFLAGMFFESYKQKQSKLSFEQDKISAIVKKGKTIYYSPKHQAIGVNEEIRLTSWKLIKSDSEYYKLEVTFEFENKSDQEVFLEDFAIKKIRLHILAREKMINSLGSDFSLLATVTVPAHQTRKAVIRGTLFKPEVNPELRQNSFIFQLLAKDNANEGIDGLLMQIDEQGNGLVG